MLKSIWLKKLNKNAINISLGGGGGNINDADYEIYQKVAKRVDIFDLGLLLINCAVGGILDTFDFTTFTCEHDMKCCCLYHCIETFENNKGMKHGLTSLISKNQRYSKEFITFLCLTTTYSYNKRISYKQLKNNDWLLSASNDKVYLNLNELLGISKAYHSRKDPLGINKQHNKRFQSLCDNLSLVLSCCDNYFKHYGIKSSDFIFNESNEKNLIELSNEMGVDKETLAQKIKPIFDNMFK
jgi:hypothetical protein